MTMQNTTMKAIVAKGYGSPSVLELQEVPMPEIGLGEVLIKVEVSAATRADTMMRSGKPYFARLFTGLRKPKHAIPGTGYAGQVVAVGAAVGNFKPGDRVFGESALGFSANAEFISLSADEVIIPMPDNLSYTEAASLCDGALTSINFLKEIAKVEAGQRVLINGASGSLGCSAVQLAKAYGAHVTGVCSTRNVGLVESLGADEVIDYTKRDFTQDSKAYDLVYDTVGKSSYQKAKHSLKEDGLFLSPVLNASIFRAMIGTALFGKRKAAFAATGMRKAEDLRKMADHLIELIKEGRHRTIIDRQFPLQRLAEAHTYIDAGHKKGNVIITHA